MAKVDETLPPPESDVQTEQAARQAELAVPAEIAADSVGEYFRTSLARIKAGESGILPVIAGLILVSILFESLDSKFLTAGNLVNLLIQAAVFSLLAMGEVFVLLLGEIDLSVGFVAGLGGVIVADLASPAHGWPWWSSITMALLACAGIGILQGTIITRIGLPSFVVTLAGLLFWEGVLLKILGNGGTIPIQDDTINNIASANISPLAGWILMLVLVGLFGVTLWRRDSKRRRVGLVAPPPAVTLLRIGGALAGGVALVLLCNHDRGIFAPIRGVPWVVLLVVGVLVVWTILLGRTRLGRYLYAIGGNAEAARRAGVSLATIRTAAFMLCSLTAGIAGIVYASRLRSISTSIDGGTLVLYAVAAAVIGGTSLFGGRGKAIHGVLGGIVIAAIDNGMGLKGFTAASKFMVTALVLLAAVTIDALSRRGRVETGLLFGDVAHHRVHADLTPRGGEEDRGPLRLALLLASRILTRDQRSPLRSVPKICSLSMKHSSGSPNWSHVKRSSSNCVISRDSRSNKPPMPWASRPRPPIAIGRLLGLGFFENSIIGEAFPQSTALLFVSMLTGLVG